MDRGTEAIRYRKSLTLGKTGHTLETWRRAKNTTSGWWRSTGWNQMNVKRAPSRRGKNSYMPTVSMSYDINSVRYFHFRFILPSLLWCCWLGGRKGIRSVKNWLVGCWRGYLSGARCRLAYGPADATASQSISQQLFVAYIRAMRRRKAPAEGPRDATNHGLGGNIRESVCNRLTGSKLKR